MKLAVHRCRVPATLSSGLLLVFFFFLHDGPPKLEAQCAKRLVAYYAYWDQWNTIPYTSADIPYSKLTHVLHAFVELDTTKTDGTLIIPAGYLEPALITSAKSAGVKVLVSFGGGGASMAPQMDAFSTVIASASTRKAFIDNIYDFCVTNGYVGADMDFEWPGRNPGDRANTVTFMSELRSRMPSPTWILSMSPPAYPPWQGDGFDFPALDPYVDFYNIQTYELHGSWSDHSGHVAPQFQSPADPDGMPGVKESLDWYLGTGGATASKLNVGIAFFGYEFTTVEDLWGPCSCNDSNAPERYYGDYIKNRINTVRWTDYWDPVAQANYLRFGTASEPGLITYDSVNAVVNKTNYALGTRVLGGVFMWELSEDYDGATQDLLDAMYGVYGTYCAPTMTPSCACSLRPTRPATRQHIPIGAKASDPD